MLWIIAAILLTLWLLGVINSITLAGFLHTLLIVAVILVLFNLAVGRRPLGLAGGKNRGQPPRRDINT